MAEGFGVCFCSLGRLRCLGKVICCSSLLLRLVLKNPYTIGSKSR